MASDRSQYNRALRKWDELHEMQRYSVPKNEGRVAILWSDHTMYDDDMHNYELNAYEEDAYMVSDDLTTCGIESQVFPAYTLEDAYNALKDPEVISIVTIGNGNLSTSYAHDGEPFDWRFVSEASTHLKDGIFVQRHCGQAIRELSVPLGMFALSRHSDVYAAYDRSLPTQLTAEDEQSIVQLHPFQRIGYRALKNLFIGVVLAKSEDELPGDG